MAIKGSDHGKSRLIFGRYVLDVHRGRLSFDGRDIAISPKPFALLAYLAARPGQLIGAEELLAAVWPDLVVSNDTVVQGIGELRRALGEAGPRLITTVPLRGYRFEPDAAPPDRRNPSRWHPLLRWRWIYGILAPLALVVTLLAIWLVMRGGW